MKAVFLVFVLSAALSFGGCKNEAGVPAIPVEDKLLPMASGNYWQFLRITFDSSGVPTDTIYLLMTVGRPDTFETVAAFPVSNLPFVFANPLPLLWANGTGGLYNVIPGVSASFVKVFPYPTRIGDSTTFSGHTVKTASLTDRAVVPAGSFTCVRYDIFQNDTLRGRLFMVPNIGIVKVWQRYHGLSALVDELRTFQLLQ